MVVVVWVVMSGLLVLFWADVVAVLGATVVVVVVVVEVVVEADFLLAALVVGLVGGLLVALVGGDLVVGAVVEPIGFLVGLTDTGLPD